MPPDIAGLHGDVAVSSLMRVEIERQGLGQDTPRPERLSHCFNPCWCSSGPRRMTHLLVNRILRPAQHLLPREGFHVDSLPSLLFSHPFLPSLHFSSCCQLSGLSTNRRPWVLLSTSPRLLASSTGKNPLRFVARYAYAGPVFQLPIREMSS